MKNLTLLFVLILIVAGCKDASDNKESVVDYSIISGTITNYSNGELSINSFDRSFKEVLPVSETGSFTDTLETDKLNYVLYDGQNPIFLHLEDGFDLQIAYDANDFKNTLNITGVGSEINNYLVKKRDIEQSNFSNYKEIYSLDDAAFKENILEVKSQLDSLLTNFKGLSEAFKGKEERNLQYAYLSYLNNYERMHGYFTSNPEFKTPDAFAEEIGSIAYDNEEDYLFSTYYKELINQYYFNESKKMAESDSIANDLAYLKTVSGVENETIKNGLLFDFANSSMGYTKDVDAFYQTYAANSTNEENNKIIEEKYNKLQALNPGKPSPKFVDYRNHDGGKTSLDDLKGKYVYVDVWATWCGPCIREIPALKEMEAKFHDKNLAFVSVSIDKESDFEKWKTMVDEKELEGVQLFADNDWNSQFVKDYQIEGIPRFILIDPHGNIVNSNAPRPSNPELVSLLESLQI